jgi:hypothetical protein
LPRVRKTHLQVPDAMKTSKCEGGCRLLSRVSRARPIDSHKKTAFLCITNSLCIDSYERVISLPEQGHVPEQNFLAHHVLRCFSSISHDRCRIISTNIVCTTCFRRTRFAGCAMTRAGSSSPFPGHVPPAALRISRHYNAYR